LNSEALIQGVIRALVVGATTVLTELLAFSQTTGAGDALGQWAIYLPIIVALLGGVLKVIGGATEATARSRGRGADATPVKRPNILAI